MPQQTCDFCDQTKGLKYYGYSAPIGNMRVKLCAECAEKEKDKIWDVSKYHQIKKALREKDKNTKKYIVNDVRNTRWKKENVNLRRY